MVGIYRLEDEAYRPTAFAHVLDTRKLGVDIGRCLLCSPHAVRWRLFGVAEHLEHVVQRREPLGFDLRFPCCSGFVRRSCLSTAAPLSWLGSGHGYLVATLANGMDHLWL